MGLLLVPTLLLAAFVRLPIWAAETMASHHPSRPAGWGWAGGSLLTAILLFAASLFTGERRIPRGWLAFDVGLWGGVLAANVVLTVWPYSAHAPRYARGFPIELAPLKESVPRVCPAPRPPI